MGNHILCSKNVLGVSILTSVTIITGALLNSIKVDATSISAQATVNVEEACTMNSTITTPHTATIPNGTYQADIGTTTINVICNDSQGYAIYAVGYTGDEIGGENSTKLVNATGNTNTIATGTATSGNTSNWAMKISTSGSSFVGTIDNSFGNYHAVPNEYTKVAHYNSATDAGNSATGSTYQTTYAAFVSSTQLAGNYAGKVKYTMVHPANEFVPHEVACAAGKICYNANSTMVIGQTTSRSAADGNTVKLATNGYKRDGYGFAGWSDKYDYSGNFYGPNESIIVPTGTTANGLSLYAIWIKSAGIIQDSNMVTSVCNNLAQADINSPRTLNSVSAFTDIRDNNTYAVAKLADGKCWMIENLRLDDAPELSSTNTHNPSLPLTNVYDTGTKSNHLSPSTSLAYDASTAPEGWCDSNSTNCMDQSRLEVNSSYGGGNYYNWYSATAGHGIFTSVSDEQNIVGDICPSGWHLTRGGGTNNLTNNEFAQLDIALGGTGMHSNSNTTPTGTTMSARWRSFPNNFVYAGVRKKDFVERNDSEGYYQTSTMYNYVEAYSFEFREEYVFPSRLNSNKHYGLNVRCIAGI